MCFIPHDSCIFMSVFSPRFISFHFFFTNNFFHIFCHHILITWCYGCTSHVHCYAKICLHIFLTWSHITRSYVKAIWSYIYVNDQLLGSAGLWVYELNSELEPGSLPALPSLTLLLALPAREKQSIIQFQCYCLCSLLKRAKNELNYPSRLIAKHHNKTNASKLWFLCCFLAISAMSSAACASLQQS